MENLYEVDCRLLQANRRDDMTRVFALERRLDLPINTTLLCSRQLFTG